MDGKKWRTIITVHCINGHKQEQDVTTFGPAWGFKCETCGTIYCSSHVARVVEVEEKGGGQNA